jgi:hypothetical protein
MATILESEAGTTRERNWRGGAGVAQLGRQWSERQAVQGGTRGAVALGRLGGDGFGHDGSKGTTGLSGTSWAERPSGLGALGRPILEKKRKEYRNRLGCQGLLGQNQIGPPEENKNCF